MNTSQAGKTIVFVGIFQVAEFDKFFFIKNGFFKEEEIRNIPLFTPEVVQINIEGVNIVITVQQIIITQFKMDSEMGKDIALLFAKYINHNIQAVGVNFSWNLAPTENLEKETKEYFFNERNKMFTEFFNTPDSMYGSYVSKDFMNGRLKLEIKPQMVTRVNIKTREQGELLPVINFAFNFHYQVAPKRENSSLVDFIKNYRILFNESEKIMALYGK